MIDYYHVYWSIHGIIWYENTLFVCGIYDILERLFHRKAIVDIDFIGIDIIEENLEFYEELPY